VGSDDGVDLACWRGLVHDDHPAAVKTLKDVMAKLVMVKADACKFLDWVR
jgi:hypothetical protein